MKATTYINSRQDFANNVQFVNCKYLINKIKDLGRYDKLIVGLSNIKDIDVEVLGGLLHADFILNDRWFIIDENPDNTWTFQENLDEDINYIFDGCRYRSTFCKKVLDYVELILTNSVNK